MVDTRRISGGRPARRAALGRNRQFHNWKTARVWEKPASCKAPAMTRAPPGNIKRSTITNGNSRVARSKHDRTTTGMSSRVGR